MILEPTLEGGDKIKILELDFLHLHEGVGHKMMKFGENQSTLSPKTSGQITRKPKGGPLGEKNIFLKKMSPIFSKIVPNDYIRNADSENIYG